MQAQTPPTSLNSQPPSNPVEAAKQLESRAIELITPISKPSGDIPAPPLIGNPNSVKLASANLLVNVDDLVQNIGLLTLDKVNNAFASYNNLVVVMGLTDARQLAYYPKLKTIAESLVQLKTVLSEN